MGINMEFYIINCTDRPGRRHVMQKTAAGTLKYMHHDLHHHGELNECDETTSMTTFGFDVRFKDGQAIFEQVRESKAAYRDGQRRKWQDVVMFTLPLLEDV